ncbi:MAG: sulfatase [Terriglobia bacterium]
MKPSRARFGSALISLWLRLMTVAIIGLLFASMQYVPAIKGWLFYQTLPDVAFGIVLRLILVALAGAALGTVCTVFAIPFLLQEASRERRASNFTKIAVAIAAFGDLSIAARILIQPLAWRAGFHAFPIFILYSIAFALAMAIPARRRAIVTSLDGLLDDKTTRRTAMALGVSTVGLIAAETVAGKMASPVIASAATASRALRPAGPNILFVTFDACSADDMSLYGYKLPTTPCLSAFAKQSTVFNQFYSASTFTTPSVASILTGLYPSEHRVYQLEGRLRRENVGRTFTRLMREAGYTTGFSTSSPYVHCLMDGIAPDFNFFPDMAYRTKGFDLWRFTKAFHQRQPYGSRAREEIDLEVVRNYPADNFARYSSFFAAKESGYAPAASLAQARSILDQMPDEGFFLWAHVYAPHAPYMPDAPWLGRFQPPGKPLTAYDQEPFTLPSKYGPELQPYFERPRRRYDEFMLQTDSAFGAFMAGLEGSGRLRNTAVVVAADHGESFEGGIFTHASKFQTRPELHIPLMVHMPGQQIGSRVETALDETALAPSLLEIAGMKRPDWMRGQSLLPWLGRNDTAPPDQGRAFTQYLATNSAFRPVTSGSAGVIDGSHQYVLDLDTGKGILRSIEEAVSRDLDRSAQNPALAHALRAELYARFPELPRKQG